MRHDHDRTLNLIEIKPLERDCGKLQVGAPALFLGPQQDHTSVASGRMPPQISEPFIRRHEPSPLSLDTGPEVVVGYSLPALPNYSHCVMASRGHQVDSLSGQVFVDLNACTHRPPSR
jgi:hypothetical protein